jgi:hypothetical protein
MFSPKSFAALVVVSLSLLIAATATPIVYSFPRDNLQKRAAEDASKISVFAPTTTSTHEWNLAADPDATSGSASVVSVAPVYVPAHDMSNEY